MNQSFNSERKREENNDDEIPRQSSRNHTYFFVILFTLVIMALVWGIMSIIVYYFTEHVRANPDLIQNYHRQLSGLTLLEIVILGFVGFVLLIYIIGAIIYMALTFGRQADERAEQAGKVKKRRREHQE